MPFAPSEVVVIMNAVENRAANDCADALHDPFAAGVGIETAELHPGEICAPKIAVGVQNCRWHIHAVLTAGQLKVFGGRRVAQAPRTEMHANPDVARFVGH